MDPADPNIGSPSAWNDVGSIRSGSNSTRYRHISQGPPPPPKKSWKKQFADGFRATVAFVFSKVGICVLVIGYLFVGAAMFQQLEGRVFQKCFPGMMEMLQVGGDPCDISYSFIYVF